MASIHKSYLKDGKTPRWWAFWSATGKRHKKAFRRRKDADAFLVEVTKEIQDGTWREVQPAPMRDVFTAWLADLETRVKLGEIKPSTANGYKSAVLRFNQRFGDFRSDQLSARTVARWRSHCAERIESGKMAPKSFNNQMNLLHSILEWARHPARSYLRHDPLVGQKRLTVRRPEAEFLEDDDIAALLRASADDPEENAVVHVALFAGLRRGEVFGLQWGDLETTGDSGGRLRVRRSNYQRKITTPKTTNSERIVDVPARVLRALERYRAVRPPMEGNFIFRTLPGAPLDPDNWYRRRYAKLRARAELRSSIGMHTLRHTYASLLIRQGENPKYVSHQLGHASASFTLDVYGHLFESTSTEAMGRLDDVIRTAARKRFKVIEGGAGS